jgi:hypothetical protein
MTTLTDDTIIIPGKYILRRITDGVIKEQYACIDSKYEYDKKILYNYYYGYFGFHEGWCKIDSIRELTLLEKKHKESGEFWNLPQQLYQSFPSDY